MTTRLSRRFGLGTLLGAALLLPASAPAEHHEKAAEGAVMIGEKINLTGKVISIDAATRTVVVEGEQGRQVSIVAPKDGPNFDQIEVGDPAAAILEVAKGRKADLIVMGSRGLGDLQGLLLGSVSHKVGHLADRTCITVK